MFVALPALRRRRGSMTTEHRSVGGSLIRAKGQPEGIFTARAVSYNRADDMGSVWLPACFTASLNKRLPVIAWSHTWEEPIGRATSWRDTTTGPEVTARLDNSPAVPRALQAIAQIASGTLTDVSVGFSNAKRRRPTAAEYQRWPGAEEIITSADMDELSLVLRGAVPDAELISMRSSRRELDRELLAGRITRAQHSAWLGLGRELDAECDTALALLRSRGIIPSSWR